MRWVGVKGLGSSHQSRRRLRLGYLPGGGGGVDSEGSGGGTPACTDEAVKVIGLIWGPCGTHETCVTAFSLPNPLPLLSLACCRRAVTGGGLLQGQLFPSHPCPSFIWLYGLAYRGKLKPTLQTLLYSGAFLHVSPTLRFFLYMKGVCRAVWARARNRISGI